MNEKDSQSLDVLGLKAYGEAAKIAVEKSFDGAGAFLSRICLPVAEELGLYFKDIVHIWRSNNVAKTLKKAEKSYKKIHGEEEKQAHPRMISSIVEQASWVEEDDVQEMWAGLLTSSCTKDGKDDSNLIFVNLLSQLTNSEVKILNFSCKNAEKCISAGGWITANQLVVTSDELQSIAQINDLHHLDRELDHLRALQLLHFKSGFPSNDTFAVLTPSSLGLHLFVRCQGSLEDPTKYFVQELVPKREDEVPINYVYS